MSIFKEVYNLDQQKTALPSVTVGKVVNTNDPQQMGRIQVYVPTLGHNGVIFDHTSESELHYFWVSYASPMAGADSTQLRGPNDGESTEGIASYGMWSIPKVGTDVLIAVVDGDQRQLYWFACLFPYATPHTLPHGRYIDEGGTVDGPLASNESQIKPLYDNLTKAFAGDRTAPEWISRGADYSAAAVSQRQISYTDHPVTSTKPEDFEKDVTEPDGQKAGRDQKYTQGYAVNRLDPDKATDTEDYSKKGNDTPKNMESTVNSFTSPGGHAWAMDDRAENNRMRFRTSTGHQIIMDDTNERIYVATNEGRNYIEMDSDGHIYVFTQESFSVRSEGDINFTTEKTFRVKSKEGIHLQTEDEYRLHAQKDIHVHGEMNMSTLIDGDRHTHIVKTDNLLVDDDIHIHGKKNIFTLSDSDYHLHSANVRVISDSNIHTESSGPTTIKASNAKLDDGGNLDLTGGLKTASAIKAGGDIATPSNSLDGHEHQYTDTITVNHGNVGTTKTTSSHSGGSASVSSSPPGWGGTDSSDAVDAEDAYWTNVTPKHEPWHRTFNGKKNVKELYTHEQEFPPTDPKVARDNKQNPGNDHERGKLWHR
ncbi:MAG: hypothetical protein JXR12_01430 [Neptunomonas phycophila]|uniref:hypothetical protein n=1 Tax=Neptunomonas phycophila TaxID=1572645 RepID=UPI003B8B72DE